MSSLQQKLAAFPRAKLAHVPTPVEVLERIATDFPGHKIYVKRDDCTGLAMGGNKVRQLEFYLGDALEKGCDTVLSTGAVQSNYMRTLAGAAAKLGLDCHIQLEERVAKSQVNRWHCNRDLRFPQAPLREDWHYPLHRVRERGPERHG